VAVLSGDRPGVGVGIKAFELAEDRQAVRMEIIDPRMTDDGRVSGACSPGRNVIKF